ncbi:hypothetical protein UCDDA912_g10191 [Diaporthe ampelina]|uniref:Uncharacterized protein n=1 Tax=Diaporthe ampelina TaxID=1214573 RepID=A0A0G2H3R0_9PEZI|nr:hypothetical protein UCDDA912_g10191 [Diaporthe ampelina]
MQTRPCPLLLPDPGKGLEDKHMDSWEITGQLSRVIQFCSPRGMEDCEGETQLDEVPDLPNDDNGENHLEDAEDIVYDDDGSEHEWE